MRILLTGSEGYIGILMADALQREGYDVLAVDTGYYMGGWLYAGTGSTPRTLRKDIRHITPEDLEDIEAVVHLAELSNDPLGQLAPDITYQINHQGSVRLATLAREAGVRRFVYASSCSVYGVATEGYVSEESPLNPQTAYAECKVLVERDVKALADDSFSPVFLRNATAYGASPRLRFDVVLNNLAGYAFTTREIKMVSDGTPWRPLVHVLDICKAVICTLNASTSAIHNETFNVGSPEGNYRIRDIAEIVAEVFPDCRVSFGENGSDNRSYRVSFEKINSRLPGFRCDWDVRAGAQQLYDLFRQVDLDEATFHFRGYTRLKQLEYLIRTGQIDASFYWRPLVL